MRPASLTWAPPFYFLFYAAAAALSPFLVIYYQDLGLKGSQIGILAGLPSLISLVGGPVWGVLSDRSRRHKQSLLLAIVGAVIFALAIGSFKTFAPLILMVALYAFFSSPIMPLVDNTTMSLLGGQKESYGRIRMWGAVGWGLAAPLIGWLIESNGIKWSFWSYAILMTIGFWVATFIPIGNQQGATLGTNLREFLTSSRWIFFLLVAFIGGMVLSMVSNYLFLYLDSLGANKVTLGLSLTVATVSEIPVLFFSNRLLRRWPAKQLMFGAILLFAIRAFAYSIIVIPWQVLLIQLLHGPTFSLIWIAGVSYADRIAPAGLGATAQALFSGMMLGLGSATGAFLGGLVYEQTGLVNVFRLAALLAVIGMVFMLFVEKKKNGRTI